MTDLGMKMGAESAVMADKMRRINEIAVAMSGALCGLAEGDDPDIAIDAVILLAARVVAIGIRSMDDDEIEGAAVAHFARMLHASRADVAGMRPGKRGYAS